MLLAWKASYNSDSMEGRGYTVVAGYFFQQSDAKEAVKDKVFGETEAIQIFASSQEYVEYKRFQHRQNALAKLTREEREALGLTEETEET